MSRVLTIALFLSLLGTGVASAADYQEIRDLSLNTNGLEWLDVEAGAGSLDISGVAGTSTIVAKAIITVGEDEEDAREIIESDLVLSLEKDGDRAVLKGYFEDSSSFFGNHDASVRLEVTMPENLSLTVDDGSGSIEIRDVAGDMDINDGSGSLDMVRVGGRVAVEDGSGSITVRDLGGDITIDDGSGSLSISAAEGNVTIDDGSGGITVKDVGGDVTILDAGSGSVEVTGVAGTFHNED